MERFSNIEDIMTTTEGRAGARTGSGPRRVGIALQTLHVLFYAAVAFMGLMPEVGLADGVNVRSDGRLNSKIQYCKECHGLSAQGYRGYYPIPRLAGQQPEYIQNQLRAFIERRRTNPIMTNVAHVLSPEMLTALADHFHSLNPKPQGGAPRDSSAKGREIYTVGVPESNVPACAACHGPDAAGQGSIPRLAGQLYPYILKALKNWDKERGQGATDTSAIMSPIAHSLNSTQIQAVAAYLSSLE